MALQFETEKIGEEYTIVPGDDGHGSELAGTIQVVRCRVHDDEQPNLQAEFDFQVWTHAEDDSTSAFLRAVKVESLPRDFPIDASPITISTVRDWPLARWEAAARGVVSIKNVTGAMRGQPVLPSELSPSRLSEAEQRLVSAEALLWSVFPEIEHAGDTPGERRHWNGLRKLAEAAVLYRELVTAGRPDPSAEMARIKNVSPATARSWIYRARQVGLLGPAMGRTAGEKTDAEAKVATQRSVLRLFERQLEEYHARMAGKEVDPTEVLVLETQLRAARDGLDKALARRAAEQAGENVD